MTAPEIGLFPDATPDEQIAYSMGWNTATAIARTEAFAAIRRAAAVARRCDAAAKASSQDRRPDDAFAHRSSAHAVRFAIRSAIGPENKS